MPTDFGTYIDEEINILQNENMKKKMTEIKTLLCKQFNYMTKIINFIKDFKDTNFTKDFLKVDNLFKGIDNILNDNNVNENMNNIETSLNLHPENIRNSTNI